jgi:triphosphatase
MRGESGIGVSNVGSTVARIAPAPLTPDAASWRSDAPKFAAPVRVRLIQLCPKTPAVHACSVTLALHGAAIAHNLECVLTTLDPEGPHQLRIALRRTRVALRVFEPVMRAKTNARLVETARALGTIAGELRDADVLIDEIIAPAARDETGLMVALTAWRQEVRGRVRARLLAANAPAMAANFANAAGAPGWLKPDALKADMTFADLIASAQVAFWEKAEPLAARLADLSHLELHQLRKAVKAMRYGAELAASAGLDGNVVPRLKRMQDALGYANDTAALEHFNPPVFGEASALQRVRESLIAQRQSSIADAISSAMREWRALTSPVSAL